MGDKPYKVTDLVVVLPGIMGSTLSRDGRLVWAPSAGAVLRVIRTFGRSLTQLRLPDGIGDEAATDGVEAVTLMPDLHILPGLWTAHVGYERLLTWLQATFTLVPATENGPPGNLLPVPYDWRLSNRYNGRRLKKILEPALEQWRAQGGEYAEAKLVFICHSMGGLIARWYVEKEEGAEVTRKLITLGTPYRGALNALEQLVNGVRKGPAPFRIDLTDFARSLPSVHQLLPEYACVEVGSDLAKTTDVSLPGLQTQMVADAMQFHDELDQSAHTGPALYDLHPIVGQRQQTATTARVQGGRVEPLFTISGDDLAGDATVPRLSASPKSVRLNDPIIRYVTERHGALQTNEAVFDELEGVLTARDISFKAAEPTTAIDVRVDEVFTEGEDIPVTVAIASGDPLPLEARLVNESHGLADTVPLAPSSEGFHGVFDAPPAGAYELRVVGSGGARASVTPVTAPLIVWGAEGA